MDIVFLPIEYSVGRGGVTAQDRSKGRRKCSGSGQSKGEL